MCHKAINQSSKLLHERKMPAYVIRVLLNYYTGNFVQFMFLGVVYCPIIFQALMA